MQIVKEIRPYFEKFFTATFTANQTDHDIKTVCKYFNEWARQILENEDKEFIQRQKETKELAILSLDYIISKENELLEEIIQEIQKIKREGKPIPKHLITSQILILDRISNMLQQKFTIGMTPTLDFSMDDFVRRQ